MKYFILSLFCITPFINITAAQAQDMSHIRPSEMVQDRSYMANPRYEAMVRAAMTNMSDTFRFERFRNLYVDTRQYDPLGDDLIEEMQQLAYTVQYGETQEEKAKAIDAYRNLVMEHMANIRVVAQALSFAKLDGVFGSVKFFTWMRKGLIREVLKFGDGKTLRDAYYVITLTEETALLGQLGLRVLDTQSVQEGQLYYNMHEVEDIRTGQKSTLFVNVTRPMKIMNFEYKKAGGGGNTFSIMRQ